MRMWQRQYRAGNLNKETAERYQQIARLLGLSASTPILG